MHKAGLHFLAPIIAGKSHVGVAGDAPLYQKNKNGILWKNRRLFKEAKKAKDTGKPGKEWFECQKHTSLNNNTII